MFCTQCGRELPKDGTPCVCGSGQAEFVVQNRTAEQEWAAEVAVLPEEPVQPEEIMQPEAETQPAEPVWEEPAQTEEPEQPAEQEPVPPMWGETQPLPVQAAPYIEPMYPPYAQPAYAAEPENPVLRAVRSVAGSPLLLITAIVLSVHFALSVVQAFMPIDLYNLVNYIAPILDSWIPGMGQDLLQEMNPVMTEFYAAQMSAGLMSIPAMIAPALSVAAVWMIYGSAKRADGPKTAGLTILQVLQILAVIGLSLCILLVIVLGIVAVMAVQMMLQEMSYYGIVDPALSSGITVGVIVVMVVLVLCVVFALVYAAKVLSTVAGVKKAIRTGIVVKKASVFVAVMCLLSAVGLVVDLYGTFVLLGWMAALVNLFAAAVNVLFALCIFKYNKAVKPLRISKRAAQIPPQPPVYPQY